ncbi:MAG: Gfo/Idh/MocA family oxidoreductase [Chloroflexia bacterium]|nr:Gfo/Idh/MocA family oxidoreductase [Chloroflexia bacterium]
MTGWPGGQPVRLGIVGAARILPAHLRGMKALLDANLATFRITAIAARRIEDAAMFRLRGEGPPPRPPVATNERDPLGAPHLYASDLHADTLPEIYDDWRTMLDDDVVDAVLILVPVGMHHRVALDCLAAGKHVLLEKPLAISVRAGQAIVEEASRHGLVAGVAEGVRFGESARAARWVIDQGLIGALQIWLSGGIGNEWSPDKIVARTPWRHQKLHAGGGGAIDIGVHLFHLIRYLMGPVAEISAYARTLEPERFERDAAGKVTSSVVNEVEDVFLANMRFENGAIGTTFWSWGGHGEPTGLAADPAVYGSSGCLKGGEVVLDRGFRGEASDLFARGALPDLRERYFPGGIVDPFALEMLDFLTAIGANRSMEASATEGVLDLATAFAVLESATANQPVSVSSVLEGSVARYQEEINDHYGI